MESRIRREVYVRFGGEGAQAPLAYGAAEVIKEFKNGKLTLGVDDIGRPQAETLTGATTDKSGVLISASEDDGKPVAIGFRAKTSKKVYRYYWLYRVKFGVPSTNLQTKGENITFSTPTIEGTVMRRNKMDNRGMHPWRAEVNEGDPKVPVAVIRNWYKQVWEPDFALEPDPEGGEDDVP